MFWALEKCLTRTVPLRTHNTCIRHHRDIVIEPNICFGRSKNPSRRDCSFEHPQHMYKDGKGIMTTVPAWCVSAHASFVFKIDSQKTQCLLIALNKMQLLKKIILYVEVIFKDA